MPTQALAQTRPGAKVRCSSAPPPRLLLRERVLRFLDWRKQLQTVDGQGGGVNDYADQSWGPRHDGRMT